MIRLIFKKNIATFVLLLMSMPAVNASWGIWDWLYEQQEEWTEYIVIQGKEICSSVVKGTLSKFSEMAKTHPEAFVKFFINISDGNVDEMPGEVLQLLKDLELVDKNAQEMDDVVKVVASWAIKQDVSGMPCVAALQDLLKQGMNDGTVKIARIRTK